MGASLLEAMAAKRRRLEPLTHPTPKAKPLTQGAIHQQRRVFREVPKSVASSVS